MQSENPIATRFGDLLSEPLRNGVYKPKEHHGSGVKIVNMGELFGHPRLRDVPMKRLELTKSELQKSELRKGDLLFARRSLVAEGAGRCSVVKHVNEPTTFESSIIRARPDPGKVDSDFLYYFFASPQGRELMRTILRQVAVSGITGGDLAELQIPLPSLPIQRVCARTLETLDDRIDLLRQTNATLESIAQGLFKSWFIDFDPVNAKAEGREPEGMDAATAALFPAEFEESALGLIPKGWSASSLGALCAASGGWIQTGPFGSQLHASDYVEEGVPVVMPQDMQGRRISDIRIARVRPLDADRLAKHKLAVGDIVFSRRGDVGRHATVSEREVGWLCGTGCLLVRPGVGAKSPAYLSQALAHPQSVEWLGRHAVGATMPNLNTGILEALPLLSPTEAVLGAFERTVGPMEQRMTLNHAHASSLSAIRDQLLPRLISGKLRLPEAQAELEDALA